MILFLVQNHAFLVASLQNRNRMEKPEFLAMYIYIGNHFRHNIQACIFLSTTILKKYFIHPLKRSEKNVFMFLNLYNTSEKLSAYHMQQLGN